MSMVPASLPAKFRVPFGFRPLKSRMPLFRSACHLRVVLAQKKGSVGSNMVLALALSVTAFRRLPEETHRPLSLGGQAEVFVQDADTAGVIRSPLTMSNLEAPHAELPPKAPMAPTAGAKNG